jgi:hypothetical protein
MQRNIVVQPDPPAQDLCGLDIFGCQIHSSHPTTVPAGDKARGSPKATSNIECMLFGREVELTEKIFGGLTAPDMELINRSEIVDGYGIDGFA